MTPLEIARYYVSLLILQYIGKEKAAGTIFALAAPAIIPQTTRQSITFAEVPAGGYFTLTYGDDTTASIDYNASADDIQTELRLLPGLSEVTVEGSIAENNLVVVFHGVPPVAELLEAEAFLQDDVTMAIAEVDVTLPTAVQNGFQVSGSDIAVGVQLDTVAKYIGVKRTGYGFYGQITLDDEDFLSLIQMGIIKNSAGSSLAFIQELLYRFFPDQTLVFDYQNMRMSYLISEDVGSFELVQMFIVQGLLPKPMAVQLATVIYAPVINTFFGFRTYDFPAFNSSPFNTYDEYLEDRPWLSYQNAVYTG